MTEGKFNSAAAKQYNVNNVNTMILRVTKSSPKTSCKEELIFGIEKEQQKENARGHN